jgi:hypothetical protein
MGGVVDDTEKADAIAEKLRQEPYRLFANDCITKSVRFKRECRVIGVSARVVVCLGLARARWFGHWLTVPVIHGWGEVAGKRIETSRPLGSAGIWCIVPVLIRPLVSLRF